MPMDHQTYCYHYGIEAQAYSLEGLHPESSQEDCQIDFFQESM